MDVQLNQISPVIWEIPKETRSDMRVSARIYASEIMLESLYKDKSLKQLVNVATLPGIQSHAYVMPDVHEGYGFPIGAVAAIDYDEGVISPGGIGYDINCGVRLLKSSVTHDEIKGRMKSLSQELYKLVPSGVGKGGKMKLGFKDMDSILNHGVNWAVEKGYADEHDLEHTESQGCIEGANSSIVSSDAKYRGLGQLGTMGAGNHFVEVDVVEEIFDKEAANVFGLYEGQIVMQVHTGSRGLGHQVATDYIKKMMNSIISFGIELPDRELVYAPLASELGQTYFAAMAASANFAWTNRQMITHEIREAWRNIFSETAGSLILLYDVAHNIAKIEEHTVDGTKKKLIVHRKGATRAFPANHPEVPDDFRSIGQPVLIPGSMGTSSYVLVGLPQSMELSFGSTCHGAGRLLSRTKALKAVRGGDLLHELNDIGIEVQTGSLKGLAEEAPQAYKNVDIVVDVVEQAGIAKKVVKLRPLAVVKG